MDVRDKQMKSANYNKLLPYFPQETIGIFMMFKLYNFVFIQKLNYNSFTYSLWSNDINSVIAPYLTYDIAVSSALKIVYFTIYPRIDIVNLFDERFSVIKNYPMPGRMYRFSINMNYGDMKK
jgi:outer membrane receptor protein involved in Fe transport